MATSQDTHVTTISGSFAPEKFKYNKATATYDAQFKVNGHHLAAAMGLPQDKLFSTEGGLSHIEGAKLWGGGAGASAMQFGTLDSKGDFSSFKSEGRSAAVIAPTGVVISGHISGDHDGMHGAQDVNFEKSAWMNPEAAERMSQYAKTADELVETEHFGAWPSVTVGKEQFAMVPKTAAVANIIDTHGKNKEFFGGVYKGKDHVLDSGDYLVSEANYNGIIEPLIDAKRDAAKPFVMRVRTGSMPTEDIHYSIPFHHALPEQTTSGEHIAAMADARQEEVLNKVRRMHGLADPEAPAEFSAPGAAGGGAAGEGEGDDE